MKFNENGFQLLEDRGFVFQTTHLEQTKKLLATAPATFYIGIDPTADDLHIGHFFGLRMARILQDCGHKCIVLVGGATALIGDPSNKSDMRKMLTKEEVERNACEIKSILHRFVRLEGANPAIIVDNADWLKDATYINFLRDVGAHFNVSEMLSKDLYKNRLAAGGLTFMEMGYMLMQAFDFVHLNNKFNCTLQIGGSDQWGNICAGVELSRKMSLEGGKQRPLMMGLTCPLLTNADGVKMGKTEKGTLWVSRSKTSAFEFFQHFVNCLDADVERLLRFFTDLPVSDIKAMCVNDIVEAKKFMACKVTELVHGTEEAENAREAANNLFKARKLGLNANSAEVQANIPTEKVALSGLVGVVDFAATLSIIKSKGEARRLIEQGGLIINGRKVESVNEQIDLNANRELLVKKGKKTFVKVIIK